MKPEVKQKWVEALRSGAYTQALGHLRCSDSYCCLGVLCDLAIKDGLPLAVESQPLSTGETLYRYGASRSRQWLPDEVMDWAGLDDWDPTPRGDTGGDTLSELNDSGDCDFLVIAEIIEKQL